MAGFTVLNKSEAADSQQAKLDRVDLEILAAGHTQNGVISGCAVTAQGTPNNTVAVAAGTVVIDNARVTVASGNVTMTAAHASLKRLDFLCVNSSGTKSWVAGTAHATPEFPEIPATSVVLAAILVLPTDTTIETDKITDKRVFVRDLPGLAAADPTEVDLVTTGAVTTLTLLDTIARSSKDLNNQTGTSYTLALADVDNVITFNNAGAIAFTFPQDSAVPIPIGAGGEFYCLGAGDVTPTQGTGATLLGGATLLTAGWSGRWRKTAANTFHVTSAEFGGYAAVLAHLLTYDHAAFAPKPLTSMLAAITSAVNNSTTLVDSGLSVSVAANTEYMVEAFIPYIASQAADIKLAWSAPAGVSGWWSVDGLVLSTSATEAGVKRNAVSWASTISSGGAGTTTADRLSAKPIGTLITGGTAGTFKMQFAQQAADATDCTIGLGAWLRLTPFP